MGRKIPGKKHRGTKDPYVQRAVRDARVANVVNAPPEFPDEQEVSKSLSRFIALKQSAKDRERRGKGAKSAQTGPRPGPHARITDRNAARRHIRELSLKAQEKMRQAQYETKFGVTLVRNRQGELFAKKCPSTAEALIGDMVEKCRKAGRKMPKRFEDEVKAVKNEARSKKCEEVKKEHGKVKITREKVDGNELEMIRRDVVRFGEVVHEPPTLVKPKAKAKDVEEGRPGRKDLLLKKLLDRSATTSATANSNPQRSALEAERRRVVELYRSLKANRRIPV